MRIAHVLRRISFDDWGGTEQVVWNIAKAQKAAGHEVRLFATTALCGTERETVDGLEIFRFRPVYPWWPMPKSLADKLDRKGGNPFVPGLGKALREWKPDVIHCHAMARIAELCLRVGERGNWGNGRLARLEREQGNWGNGRPARLEREQETVNGERVRCIISLHGGGANVPDEEAKSLKAPTRGLFPWGKIVDKLMRWTRRIPEDFGGIVCVGEDEAEKYKGRHPHVMFLPNGVDCSLFEAARESGRTRASSPSGDTGPLRVLCVARIDRQKNQMMLVEALARFPDMSVRLVGPVTQPDYRSELEARASELGVSDRLSFAGALKPGSAQLLSEYAGADIFVLPSRHEPFGIVVLEAWAAGLPVIASDVGGLGRLCAAHPGAALTFAPGDVDAMAGALKRAASDGGLLSRLSAAGIAAAEEYDWRTLAEKLVVFYANI